MSWVRGIVGRLIILQQNASQREVMADEMKVKQRPDSITISLSNQLNLNLSTASLNSLQDVMMVRTVKWFILSKTT